MSISKLTDPGRVRKCVVSVDLDFRLVNIPQKTFLDDLTTLTVEVQNVSKHNVEVVDEERWAGYELRSPQVIFEVRRESGGDWIQLEVGPRCGVVSYVESRNFRKLTPNAKLRWSSDVRWRGFPSAHLTFGKYLLRLRYKTDDPVVKWAGVLIPDEEWMRHFRAVPKGEFTTPAVTIWLAKPKVSDPPFE